MPFKFEFVLVLVNVLNSKINEDVASWGVVAIFHFDQAYSSFRIFAEKKIIAKQ